MDKFLNFLQDKKAVAFACIMSLITQLWHSIQAFVHLEIKGTNEVLAYIFGIFFAVSTSFAILIFTIRGSRKLAYFFLAVEVFVNIIHYGVMGMIDPMILFPTIFMCLIVPVTISVYSAAINDNVTDLQENGNNNLGKLFTKPEMNPKIMENFPKMSATNLFKSGIDPFEGHPIMNESNTQHQPNVQDIEKTEQTPEIGMKDEHFIKEVNDLVGFDITNPKDKSGIVSEDKKKSLRSLWKKRNSLSKQEIKNQMETILNEANEKPLFKGL